MRVLLVEDDAMLGDGLQAGLSQHGFTVDWVDKGQVALHSLEMENFDTVILDLGLPDLDGFQVLKNYRAKNGDVPILVLTARNEVGDKLSCLDGGADDYLVKPVDIRELAARVRVLMRRKDGRRKSLIKHGNVEVDPKEHRVTANGVPIELSLREFNILHALIRSPGRVVSKEQLEQIVYGWESDPDSNVVQVHLHNLRRKVGHDFIRTIRGVGYVIE